MHNNSNTSSQPWMSFFEPAEVNHKQQLLLTTNFTNLEVVHFQPCLVPPEKCSGSTAKCKGFLMQCAILFASAPSVFPREVPFHASFNLPSELTLIWAHMTRALSCLLPSTSYDSEPLKVACASLTAEEKESLKKRGLCLYYTNNGHFHETCTLKREICQQSQVRKVDMMG